MQYFTATLSYLNGTRFGVYTKLRLLAHSISPVCQINKKIDKCIHNLTGSIYTGSIYTGLFLFLDLVLESLNLNPKLNPYNHNCNSNPSPKTQTIITTPKL